MPNKWKKYGGFKNSEDLLVFPIFFTFVIICQFNTCFMHILFMSSISEEKTLCLTNMHFQKYMHLSIYHRKREELMINEKIKKKHTGKHSENAAFLSEWMRWLIWIVLCPLYILQYIMRFMSFNMHSNTDEK